MENLDFRENYFDELIYHYDMQSKAIKYISYQQNTILNEKQVAHLEKLINTKYLINKHVYDSQFPLNFDILAMPKEAIKLNKQNLYEVRGMHNDAERGAKKRNRLLSSSSNINSGYALRVWADSWGEPESIITCHQMSLAHLLAVLRQVRTFLYNLIRQQVIARPASDTDYHV